MESVLEKKRKEGCDTGPRGRDECRVTAKERLEAKALCDDGGAVVDAWWDPRTHARTYADLVVTPPPPPE